MRMKFSTTSVILGAFTALLTCVPAHAGTWVETYTSTNGGTSSPTTSTSQQLALTGSYGTTFVSSASVTGITSGALVSTANGSYSGTCTFTWQPSNSTDWPTSYTITCIHTADYSAYAANGTGAAQVENANFNVLASANASSGNAVNSFPVTTTTTSTPVTNLTKTVTTTAADVASSVTGGWQETNTTTVETQYAYGAAYFTAQFASPSSIVLTFPISQDYAKATTNFSSTSASGAATASASMSTVYSGQ